MMRKGYIINFKRIPISRLLLFSKCEIGLVWARPDVSYVILSQMSFVFFKYIIFGPKESPKMQLWYRHAVLFLPPMS